jgi:putative ABC transport system permease protein
MLLLGIEKIKIEVKNNFVSSVAGTDLIIGARGSPTQLVLYSVFHLGRSTNNINQNTIDYINNHKNVEWAIPISLGDTYKKFPVIATERIMFEKYKYDYDKHLSFKEGNVFDDDFEVVVGYKTGLKVGDIINLSHGRGEQTHKEKFKVVGILAISGTPIDTSLIITLNAMDIIHAGYLPKKRQITSMFIGLKEKRKIFSVQREFNSYKGEPLTAILPGATIEEMWSTLNIFEKALILISSVTTISSLMGLSATVLAGLNERKREITILRVLGANPLDICFLISIEVMFVILCGIMFGVLCLYLSIFAFSSSILIKYGIRIGISALTLNEYLLLLKIFASGVLLSLIPSIKAYSIGLRSGLK